MDRTSANRTRISLHFFFFFVFSLDFLRRIVRQSRNRMEDFIELVLYSLSRVCVYPCVCFLFLPFFIILFLLIFILPSMCVLCIFVRSFFSPFFNLLFKYCVHFLFCLITFLSSGSFKLEMVCSSFYYFSFFLNNVRTFDRSTRTLDDKK